MKQNSKFNLIERQIDKKIDPTGLSTNTTPCTKEIVGNIYDLVKKSTWAPICQDISGSVGHRVYWNLKNTYKK